VTRKTRRLARFAAVIAALAAPLLYQAANSVAAHASAPQAVISLTFDDSDLNQFTNAFPILQQYGMTGTFYTITGYIGVNPGYMTLPDLQALYNAGNEIGGHTVLHPDLTQISADEASREICDSRNTLLGWGFPVTDFAYPYGSYSSQTEQIAAQCGYNSARADSNNKSPYGCQTGCPLADTIPPADPYSFQAPASIQDYWSLSDIESLVTEAEQAGGWQPIIFHNICDNDCDPYSVTPAIFSAFLAWLQGQPVAIENVNQVIGGSVSPPVSAPSVPPAPPGSNGVVNPSLETADQFNAGLPYCWSASGASANGTTFAETSNAHSGSTAETITVASYTSGDAKLLIKQDLGQCAPSAVPGDAYLASAWYQSTVPTRFVIYYRDANGGWHYWTQSPQYPAAAGWTQARWATPAVPAAATGLSFGMNIAANGTLTTDDYSLVDTGGPPTPPTVTLTGPAAGSTLTGQVTFSATATSPVGIASVSFQVNGVTVATSTTAPYTATWDSSTVGDGQVTVTAVASDISGLQATTAGQGDVISNAASRGGSLIANGSLESVTGAGTTPDCWHEGGTGTWAATWADTTSAHSGSNAVSLTMSSYTSGDAVLDIRQDASACSPGVTPGSTYTISAWYQSTAPTNILVWYENSSGNWVYWTQSKAFAASSGWSEAGFVTPAVPSGAVAVSFGLDLASVGTLTMDDYAMVAGSPAPPTVSLTGPSPGAALSGQVTFAASATSAVGISAVNFLVNGVVVATSSSAPYTATWNSGNVGDGPVTVTAQAVDNVGTKVTTSGQADSISNAPGQSGNMLGNYLLQTNTSGGSTPYCWHQGGTGTSTYSWAYNASNGPPGGGDSETLTISSYASGDRILVTTQDTSACSPRVTAGRTYTLGAWYQSTAATNIIVYYLNASGNWVYWTQSKAIPAASSWASATFTTPAVPAGATALSFGVGLGAVGALTTGDYTMTAN
jgi:peptidoglycan/xylan/chitin deacetylase (PgdA/CDA1 family)